MIIFPLKTTGFILNDFFIVFNFSLIFSTYVHQKYIVYSRFSHFPTFFPFFQWFFWPVYHGIFGWIFSRKMTNFGHNTTKIFVTYWWSNADSIVIKFLSNFRFKNTLVWRLFSEKIRLNFIYDFDRKLKKEPVKKSSSKIGLKSQHIIRSYNIDD